MSASVALLLSIRDARQAFNTESSIFLSERLVQSDPAESHKCILAESYLMSQQYSNAYQLLLKCDSPRARFLKAKACFRLEKLEEAADLLQINPPKTESKSKPKTRNHNYLLNIKKGLTSFSDFFGSKKKSKKESLNKISVPKSFISPDINKGGEGNGSSNQGNEAGTAIVLCLDSWKLLVH